MGLSTYSSSIIEYILIHYRWVLVCCFLLPISFMYDIFIYVRSWIIFQLNSAPKRHNEKVLAVQNQIIEWNKAGRQKQLCTGRPGWQAISFRFPKYKEVFHKIHINLVDVVNIDVHRKVVKVEPLVTMGQLTATLEPLGWTIPVLPELDDLTVGGLVMGTGVETSSHKHGLFQHTCVSYDLVLPSGETIHCSKDENSDLYYAVPWSYGTLGFLVACEIEIIPANRFVTLEYHPVHSLDHAISVFTEHTMKGDENQFVEGIMYNCDQGVIMVGNMTTSAEPGKLNKLGLWNKPWFFKHVETFLSNGPGVEYIPLRDYYHRHSRSIFWEIQEIIPFGNNILFRYLFGWMVPPKISLLKLTQPNAIKKLYEANHLIQDMIVPLSQLKETLKTFDKETRIYPLWLCPVKLPNNPGMIHPPKDNGEEMYVDVGAYGVPKIHSFHAEQTTRRLEEFVRKNNGFQMLYADTYMTREEFREMFDHKLYDEVRKKYNCLEAFPEVYDKVCRSARY